MNSVDVVVPCYRYGHFLRECVGTVLNQADVDVRILIIDDASPDDTAEIGRRLAREDSRVTFRRHSENQGHIATYNEGIQWAAAKYFLLLSADDYLLPGALARTTRLMEAHSGVGFTYGKVRAQRGRTSEIRDPREPFRTLNEDWRIYSGLEFIKLSGAHCLVATPTAVVRTALQQRVGGYRPELPHSGDMEMWLRLAAHASVGYINYEQAVYRFHESNMSADYYREGWLPDLQQRKSAIDCFFTHCGNMVSNPEGLRRYMRYSLGCAALGFASEAFNDSAEETSKRLLHFALEVSPEVKRSFPWIKLSLKQFLGRRAWFALQPSVRRVRNVRKLLFPPTKK